jgi:chromate transporter
MAFRPADGYLVVVIFGLSSGLFLKLQAEKFEPSNIQFALGNRLTVLLVILFFSILIFVFTLFQINVPESYKLIANLYKSEALVFGGGHVVLPLLEANFVPTELLGEEQFFVSYGVAQAIPGPLFSIVSYCRTLMQLPSSNIFFQCFLGLFVCFAFIFQRFCLYLPLFGFDQYYAKTIECG